MIASGTRLLHYRLIEPLGHGGMGIVWRAQDERLDRQVAVKILPESFADDPERRSRFAREAKAVAALNHPNIVTVFSVEEAGRTLFIVMELVTGGSLATHIPPNGLSLEPFLELAIPLAEAVSIAHARGIIHRDLKPSNILLTNTGTVKILDFGLALYRPPKTFAADATDSTVTMMPEEGVFGTISYTSPEQIRGEPLDHRSDIFSLGVVYYEMATGRLPFEGTTAADVIAAILRDQPRPADEWNAALPRGLGIIIGNCLEKDAQHRTQSAVDLRHELEQLRSGGASLRDEFGSSIAVLPFSDLSREKDQEYFCEGIQEEIINSLSRIAGLHVASRTSALRFKGTAVDSREMGRSLRVSALVEGSIRKSGNRLRISTQLIDAENGYHLWSETYDREITDVFQIQEEIARQILEALQVKLSPTQIGAMQRVPTSDVQAYDYYLRGRKFYFQYTRRDVEFALQLFSRAIELDPRYALAWAGLADCWSYIYLYAERTEAARQQADRTSCRAVQLDPESAQAHSSRGVALSLTQRDAEAEQAFETAIRLDADLFEAYYFYARHAFAQGQLEKAVEMYEKAMQVRAEDYQAPLLVAQTYDVLGRTADARTARTRGVRLAEESLIANPRDARALYMAANGLVALGEREKGRKWAQDALALAPQDPMVLYNVGCIYALSGDAEQAIACLEFSVRNGLSQKGWFEHDSNLDSVRDHPRFRMLMKEVV
jgi:non-specific serine/threonine protein kinase